MRDSLQTTHETGTPAKMHRREFLIGGMRVGVSFLAADALGLGGLALPAFAQTKPAGLPQFGITEPPAHLDDSLNIMAAFLVEYQPPQEQFPASGAWRARYDVLEWIGTPRPPSPEMKIPYARRNRAVGQLAVMRRPGAGPATVGYDVDYAIELNGFTSTLRGSMQCAPGQGAAVGIPALREWDADYEKHAVHAPGSAVGLSEDGLHEDGVLTIKSRAGVRRIAAPRPIAPQWAVMDALRDPATARAMEDVEFDLLYDLTSLRPRQRVRPCGTLTMSLGGATTTLHGYVQTGSGTEPIHYWLDGEGRPLLLTGGLVSCALTAIEPA